MLSFHVTRRTHELGVRMALGAPRSHVLGLMLAMGGRLVLIGLGVGIAASLASTRLLRSQLFGVQATDPLAYVAVVVLLGAVTLLACYVPRAAPRASIRWWRCGRSEIARSWRGGRSTDFRKCVATADTKETEEPF